MAKAEVELVGSLTHNSGGRSFVKGRPQVITNAAEIAAFKANSDFKVKMLSDAPEKAAKKAPSKPKSKPQAPPEPQEEQVEPEKKTEYTRSKLGSMRKADLIEIGLEHDLAFTGDETAKQMVEDILLAQEGD